MAEKDNSRIINQLQAVKETEHVAAPPSTLRAANCGPSFPTYLLTEAKRNRNSNLESEIFGWMEKKTLLRPLLSLSFSFPSSVNERANGAHRSVRCGSAGPATLITTALPSVALRNERAREGRLAHSVSPRDIIHLATAKKCSVEI